MLKGKPHRIIISRTDSIGDVILTFPLAGILKSLYPDCRIIFLGKSYTRAVIETCQHLDEFADWSKISAQNDTRSLELVKELNADIIIHVFPVSRIASLARKARIPFRIGATGRLYHWYSCNKLVRLSRRRSSLHEAQLNLKLIKILGAKKHYSLEEIQGFTGMINIPVLPERFMDNLDKNKFNLILHPKSKGSAREWGLDNFSQLIDQLPPDKFNLIITGTKEEGILMSEFLSQKTKRIHNLTGKLSLQELIGLIAAADGLLAASTGPLHIAASLRKLAIGIYPPIKPMDPGRWRPVGEKAKYLVLEKECNKCRKSNECQCIKDISPEQVRNILMKEVDKT